MSRLLKLIPVAAVALASSAALSSASASARATFLTPPGFTFELTRNTPVIGCLPNARAEARISQHGASQQLDVFVAGLPANDTFTVFVLQLPHAPFGMSWYQGDIETDAFGVGHARFNGIFSDETFMMAPGSASTTIVDPSDAATNPQTAPVHMFHIGIWFDSVSEAQAAACPTN